MDLSKYRFTMNVAIIPARSGSKRIAHKNIKPFLGKPIIAYSIEAAARSGLFEHIVVSTDSEAIASVARKYGSQTPFLRPPELSDDHTPTAPVIVHALNRLAEEGVTADYVCCIYATAPFVRPEFLNEGYEIITREKVSSVFSVTSFPFPIFRALKINQSGGLEMYWPEHELTRSNDLPEAFHDAGQFYWVERASFLQEERLYSKDSRPVVIPRKWVQDIDTPEDWATAESMYRALAFEEAAE